MSTCDDVVNKRPVEWPIDHGSYKIVSFKLASYRPQCFMFSHFQIERPAYVRTCCQLRISCPVKISHSAYYK